MRKKIFYVVFISMVAMAVLVTFGLFQSSEAGLESAPKVKLRDVDGNSHKLADFKGSVVIINFWAVWCPPCKKEIPSLVDLQTRYGEKGLKIFGIALDSGEDEDIRKKAQEFGVTYPVVNGDYSLRRDFGGIRAVPTTLVINSSLEPKSWNLYSNYGDFDGTVLKVLVAIDSFIATYPAWDDTVINQYTVAGQYYSGEDFNLEGEFTCIGLISGDANGDRTVDVGDIVFLVSHIFLNGLCPCPNETGDATGDGLFNVGDVVYLVNHIFRGGPGPSHP